MNPEVAQRVSRLQAFYERMVVSAAVISHMQLI